MKRWLTILLLCAPCFGQAWSNYIDPSRAIDWTHAGSPLINDSRTQCVTTQCNTVSGGTVTTTSLNAAITSAPAHTYILIPSGTFTISGGISDTGVSNITLRGAGPLLTDLVFTGTASCSSPAGNIPICIQDSTAYYAGSSAVLPGGSNACNWTAGYTQGATSITLNTCGSTPPVNQFIILDQASDTTDNSGVFVCNVSTCNNEAATSQDGRTISGNNHAQTQFAYVTAVSGSGSGPYTVTIAAPGLYMNNWSEGGAFTGTQIGAWWPGQITGVGIENLTVDYSGINPTAGTVFYDCYGCWVKNYRSLVYGSTFAGRNHIWLYQSAFDTIRDSYIFGTHGAEESYGVETLLEGQSLIENVICDFCTAPVMNGSGTGNVESYNYFPRSVFSLTQMNWQSGLYAVHNVSDQMSLYEGNVGPEIEIDNDWGTGPVSATMFRNYLNGHTIGQSKGAFSNATNYNPWDIVTYSGNSWAATEYIASGGGNPSSPNWFELALATGASENTDPLIIMWGARGINAIGNVLGDSAYQVQYILSPTTGSGNADKSIYLMGYRGNQAAGATDNLVQSSLMLWGNYDTVNSAVRWNTTEASPASIPFLNANFTSSYFTGLAHTLPSSFYLASEPAFYTMQTGITQPPYPFAGPDVTGGSGPGGYSYANPAQACYNSLTFTSGIANFDANACYYGSGSTVTPPPALGMFAWDWDGDVSEFGR